MQQVTLYGKLSSLRGADRLWLEGLSISTSTGWTMFYAVGVFLTAASVYIKPSIPLCLVLIHVVRRLYECLFITGFSNKRMHPLNMVVGGSLNTSLDPYQLGWPFANRNLTSISKRNLLSAVNAHHIPSSPSLPQAWASMSSSPPPSSSRHWQDQPPPVPPRSSSSVASALHSALQRSIPSTATSPPSSPAVQAHRIRYGLPISSQMSPTPPSARMSPSSSAPEPLDVQENIDESALHRGSSHVCLAVRGRGGIPQLLVPFISFPPCPLLHPLSLSCLLSRSLILQSYISTSSVLLTPPHRLALLFTLCNLSITAVRTRRWYAEKFKSQPMSNYAIVPLML